MNRNELKHYGVLGMKRIRRCQLNKVAETRKPQGDKRSNREIRNELRNNKEPRDNSTRRYGLGSYRSLKHGQSRAKSFVKGGLDRTGNSLLQNIPSLVDEGKSRVNNKYLNKTKPLKSNMKKEKINRRVERFIEELDKTAREKIKYKNAKRTYKQNKQRDNAQLKEFKRNINK